MALFADRTAAGRALARRLLTSGALDQTAPGAGERPLVLALPRGGVPVAVEVALAVGGELDVLVARKVGLPWDAELGVGAVTMNGPPTFDHELLRRSGLVPDQLADAIAAERAEVRRRLVRYRGDRPAPVLAGRTVVVVDDGLATGVTARAALAAVRAAGPGRLVLAAPVAAADRAAAIEAAGEADAVVAVRRTGSLGAVGRWYVDFHQLTDDEVTTYLR